MLKKLLEDLFDWFMLFECEIYFLKNDNDKGNGFYERKFVIFIGNFEIFVLRIWIGGFRFYILFELYKRVDEFYIEFFMFLVINGYFEIIFLNIFKSFDLFYFEDEFSRIKNNFKNELDFFK